MNQLVTQYDEPPLDEEPMGKSLVPIEERLTMIDVDGAAAAYEAYLELCRRILDDNDYATIRGIKARKRSGWAKLRRFYGVTIMVTEQQRVPRFSEWEPGQAFVYRFTVTGCLGDRIEEADGACESTELEGSNIAPTEHNVRAKALTRAKNRVTADLIGGGEVSAEELNGGAPAKPKKAKKHKKASKAPSPKPSGGDRPDGPKPKVESAGDKVTVGLIQEETNAQLEAMGYKPHYASRVHTIKAMESCGYKGTATKYLSENFVDIVACLIDRRVAERAEREQSE